jgi:hypothetical protein
MKVGDWIVSEGEIEAVDLSRVEELVVDVYLREDLVRLHGVQAVDFVMEWRPSALEGRRMRFARHAWAFHNLVAHPALQVLTWLGMRRLGMRVHDATVPRPRGPGSGL